MDKYTIAPPAGSSNNSVGAEDRPWHEGYFDSVKLNGGDLGSYLAESTGYGIVSGCEPTISGLTVTVGAGIVHLADGTRKEIAETNITLDAADSTNPRIDLVYIDSTGTVAKVTGTAAASPSAPALPTGGISVAQVTVEANGTTGVVTYKMDMLVKRKLLVKTINRFSKETTLVSDYIGSAYGEAMTYNTKTKKIIVAMRKLTTPAETVLLVVNKDTYAIESTYTLGFTDIISGLSYNASDDVIYATCANSQFYKIDATDMTSYTSLIVPTNSTFVAHDNVTGHDLTIDISSGKFVFKVYTNGFDALLNTVTIADVNMIQDICFHNDTVYGCNFAYFTEIDVVSGDYVQIASNSWNEIEGIEFVDSELFVYLHQANANGVDYLYKYMPENTPQEYNKISQSKVQDTVQNLSLNLLTAEGTYRVLTNDSSTSAFPGTETGGILIVTNDSKMTGNNVYVIHQRFISITAPFSEYTRAFVRNNNEGVWTAWEQSEEIVSKDISFAAGYVKYASGLIVQWGYIVFTNLSAGYQSKEITYPITFPTNAVCTLVSLRRGSNVDTAIGMEPHTASSATIYFTMGAGETALGAHYIAIGK